MKILYINGNRFEIGRFQTALLRLREEDSKWLIRTAISYLPLRPWRFDETTKEMIQINLKALLQNDIKDTYGNPFVIFILLRIILPIVLRLVIEWWLNQEDTTEDRLDWIP